jgi:GNAT superfamily N-acetyltransferase
VVVRRAHPLDAEPLARMLGRCSVRSRCLRFHGGVTEWPTAYLRRCLYGEQPAQEARVAEWITDEATGAAPGPRVPHLVGLASVGAAFEAPWIHEACALVEDRWQRRGIGRMLVNELFAHARGHGIGRIRLDMCRSQPELVSYVLAQASVASTCSAGCDVRVDIDVCA